MNYRIPVFFEHGTALFYICEHGFFVGFKFYDAAAQIENFFVDKCFIVAVHKKIELNAAAVDMPVIIHDDRVNAADNGFADNLSNSKRSFACACGNLAVCVCTVFAVRFIF